MIAEDLLGRAVFVAVRGSQEGKDWLTDFWAAPTLKSAFNGNITFHKGFWEYTQAIYPKIKDVVMP